MSKKTPVVTQLTLALRHTNLEGRQETPENLTEWITGCLNCNVFRVKVEVQTLLAQPAGEPSAIPGTPLEFTPAQRMFLRLYAGGEFEHLLALQTEEALDEALAASGNQLLRYLVKDASASGTGGGLDETVVALEAALHDIGVLRDALLRAAHN